MAALVPEALRPALCDLWSGRFNRKAKAEAEPAHCPLIVKNTFIDEELDRSFLEGFYEVRAVRSSPALMDLQEKEDARDCIEKAGLRFLFSGSSSCRSTSVGSSSGRSCLDDSPGVPAETPPSRCSAADGNLLRACHAGPAEQARKAEVLEGDVQGLDFERGLPSPLPDAMASPGSPESGPVSEGQWEAPNLGSVDHHKGGCRPCAHAHTNKGCRNGAQCTFCHLCPPGELRRQQKAKRAAHRLVNAETSELSQ